MAEVSSSTLGFPVSSSRDVLSEVLRAGAQQMLTTAIEAEVAEWVESHRDLRDECLYTYTSLIARLLNTILRVYARGDKQAELYCED